MFHELTYAQERQIVIRRIVRLVAIVLIFVICVFAVRGAQANAREQGALSVRESILTAAKQCCAVEGSYPSTLAHLENDYGLVINHNDYVVSYEWFADNVLPTVVVTPR